MEWVDYHHDKHVPSIHMNDSYGIYSLLSSYKLHKGYYYKNDDVKHNFSTLLARCYVVTSFCNI